MKLGRPQKNSLSVQEKKVLFLQLFFSNKKTKSIPISECHILSVLRWWEMPFDQNLGKYLEESQKKERYFIHNYWVTKGVKEKQQQVICKLLLQ